MKIIVIHLTVFTVTFLSAENTKCGITNQKKFDFRIVGGMSAKQDDVPWQVSLTLSRQHICGGSIISKNCILTAAHCLERYRRRRYPISVVAGSLVRSRAHSFGSTHRVLSLKFHPKWDPKKTHSDLMVLCVRPEIMYRNKGNGYKSAIGPVCLAPANFKFNGTAMISGFGRTSQFGQPSNRLMFINEQVLSHKVCKTLYGRSNFPYDQKTMLCYNNKLGVGTCQGDSGGPLVVFRKNQWFQTGIVSFGSVCGYSPTVFTRVASFSDWIQRTCNTCK